MSTNIKIKNNVEATEEMQAWNNRIAERLMQTLTIDSDLPSHIESITIERE